MTKLSNKFPVKTGPQCNWCYGSDREQKCVLMVNVAKRLSIICYWGLCLQDSLA